METKKWLGGNQGPRGGERGGFVAASAWACDIVRVVDAADVYG